MGCNTTAQTSQALQPKPKPTPATGLSSDNLSQLLVGEFSLQRGDSKAAALHLLKVARSTQDLHTAKRATYLAQFAQNSDLLKKTSLLWSQLAPQDPLPWQYIAQSASLMGQFNQATEALAEELKRGGGAGVPYVANLTMGDTKATQVKLQQNLQSWLQTYPNHKHLSYALALMAKNSQQIDGAIEHIKHSLAQDAHYLQAQILYAELLIANQKTLAADTYLSQFTQPLSQAPRHLITLHAQVLTLMAKYPRAYAYFYELTRRYPADLGYNYSAGLLAYENHQYTKAYQHLQQVIELNPDSHSAYYYMGLSALREDLLPQALGYLKQVTKGADRLNAITLLLDLDAPSKGQRKAYFDQLRLKHKDLSADLFYLQTEYLQNIGDTDAAIFTFQSALKQFPEHIALLYNYALLAQALHQFSTTELMLQRIIDLEPNHTDALNALGYAYADQGVNLVQAELLINKALTREPNNAAIIDSLGWVSYRLGHLHKSLNLLTRAYAIMPAAEIAAHLGAVKWALGDTEGAFKTWNLALSLEPDNALIKQAILDSQNEFESD